MLEGHLAESTILVWQNKNVAGLKDALHEFQIAYYIQLS